VEKEQSETEGVKCERCVRVYPRKSYFPKGKHSVYCPVCRRKDTRARTYARGKLNDAVAVQKDTMARRVSLSRIKQMIAREGSYIKRTRKLEPTKNREASVARRQARIGFYEAAMSLMNSDMDRGVFLPTMHYIKGEDYDDAL